MTSLKHLSLVSVTLHFHSTHSAITQLKYFSFFFPLQYKTTSRASLPVSHSLLVAYCHHCLAPLPAIQAPYYLADPPPTTPPHPSSLFCWLNPHHRHKALVHVPLQNVTLFTLTDLKISLYTIQCLIFFVVGFILYPNLIWCCMRPAAPLPSIDM